MTSSQLLSDQAIPFADFPVEYMLWLGRQIECLVVTDAAALTWEDGGKLDAPDIIVRAERAQFTGLEIPQQGAAGIAFRSKSWRISQPVQTEDDAASIQFTLSTESQ